MSPALDWRPPAGWLRISTVDMHTAGEPVRVIVDGFPQPAGADQLERRRDARERFDHLRRALMWEPRGHADMYGCLLTPPATPDAHFGVLFLHNEGYSTMCGHAIVAVTKLAVEGGLVPPRGVEERRVAAREAVAAGAAGEPRSADERGAPVHDGVPAPETVVRIDTPAGRVTARARSGGESGEVSGVRFENVPSFVVELDAAVTVPELGEVRYDLAFGGAFYAFVDAASLGVELDPASVGRLVELSRPIKKAVAAAHALEHPESPDLGFLYGVVFTGAPHDPAHHSRNVCLFADAEVDRSPTGTGVSARLAIHHAHGELEVGERIVVESVIGTCFEGRVMSETEVEGRPAVVPEIAGSAHVTGRHEFLIDPEDPLRHGFLLR